jgi:hypothetical protein
MAYLKIDSFIKDSENIKIPFLVGCAVRTVTVNAKGSGSSGWFRNCRGEKYTIRKKGGESDYEKDIDGFDEFVGALAGDECRRRPTGG